MKFLCLACDEAMTLDGVEGFDDGSLSVTFRCPKCRGSMAMLTNPHETQLVRSLGVNLGGGPMAHEALKLVRSALKGHTFEAGNTEERGEAHPRWMEDAKVKLERVPEFLRPMVRKRIETFAKEKGYTEITISVMDEAKARFGM